MFLKRALKNLSLKSKLIVSYTFIIVTGILLVGMFSYIKAAQYISEDVSKSVKQTLTQAKDNIEYKISDYQFTLGTIANDNDLQQYLGEKHESFDEIIDAFTYIKSKLNTAITTGKMGYKKDINELIIYMSNPSFKLMGGNIREIDEIKDEDWYKSLMSARKIWRETYVTESGNYMISMYGIIYNYRTNKDVGVIEVKIDENYMFEQIKNIKIGTTGIFYVASPTGKVISSSRQEEIGKTLDNSIFGIEEIWKTNNGIININMGGQKYKLIFDTVKATGWKVVGLVRESELTARLSSIKDFSIVTGVICILLLLVFSVIISGIFTSDFRKLIKQMNNIEKGNLEISLETDRNDEIGEINRNFTKMLDKLKYMINEVLKAQLLEKEAEVKVLQEQINPHFLYNTLSTINWMAINKKAYDISSAIEALSNFYRLSLNKGKQIISFEGEIEQVKAYLEIQKLRYEDSVDVLFDIDERIYGCFVPKLIIQPIVENIFIHGIDGKSGRSTIIISAKLDTVDNNIVIKVIDDGYGVRNNKYPNQAKDLNDNRYEKTGGVGISNIDQRIKIFFGDDYGVSFFSLRGAGTAVTIKIPANGKESIGGHSQ